MESCTLCEHWSAHKALRLGLLTRVVPALKVDGRFVPNPLVVTDRWLDEGQIVHGEFKAGAEREAGKQLLARGEVDLSLLDQAVEALVYKLANTFPGCLSKTHRERAQAQARALGPQQGNQPRLAGPQHDDRGPRRASAPSTRARRACREADFLLLRRRLAEGATWDDQLIDEILARAHGKA